MRKPSQTIERMVSKVETGKKVEKVDLVQFAQIRRHSRVLYIPLEALPVRLLKMKKGDIVKFRLIELRRAPDENARLEDVIE